MRVEPVEAALSGLAAVDRDAADAAQAAFEALTAGEGLEVVTGHGVADFLWYELPVKWLCDLQQKLLVAAALGELFTRLDLPRYASLCTGEATADIITAYGRRGRAAGLKAYQAALDASGYRPADVPGVLVWGSVMGTEEACAYWSVAAALEEAMAAGQLRPGRAGWRRAAARVTGGFLHSVHEGTGSTWLQWVHTERLQRFADSRGPGRGRLAGAAADRLVAPAAVPPDAPRVLAPVRWLLEHAVEGAALTATGNLARPLVAQGCHRFDWLTLTGNPRSESDIVELWTLRDWVKQAGLVRRCGRTLLLSTTGKAVHGGGTAALWQATMQTLLDPDAAQAAAGEIALLLLLSGRELDHQGMDRAVADALAGEGWHRQSTGEPVPAAQTAGLLGGLRRRLRLLGLTTQQGLGEPIALTAAGRAAAHTALRARALRPRHHPTG